MFFILNLKERYGFLKTHNLIFSTMVLLAAFVMATFVSCKKDDDSPQSKMGLITGKNFVISAKTISPPIEYNGIETTDLFSTMDDCDKDDITIFKTDSTATFDEGATKCDAGDLQQSYGTWQFLDNETKLSVTSDGVTESYDLIELSDTKLKVSSQIIDDNGNGDETFTITITFSAN